jgi:hypothetical protein
VDAEGTVCEDLKLARDVYRQVVGKPLPSLVKACTKKENDRLTWWTNSPNLPFHKVRERADDGASTSSATSQLGFELTELGFAATVEDLGDIRTVIRALVMDLVKIMAQLPQEVADILLKTSDVANNEARGCIAIEEEEAERTVRASEAL